MAIQLSAKLEGNTSLPSRRKNIIPIIQNLVDRVLYNRNYEPCENVSGAVSNSNVGNSHSNCACCNIERNVEVAAVQ